MPRSASHLRTPVGSPLAGKLVAIDGTGISSDGSADASTTGAAVRNKPLASKIRLAWRVDADIPGNGMSLVEAEVDQSG